MGDSLEHHFAITAARQVKCCKFYALSRHPKIIKVINYKYSNTCNSCVVRGPLKIRNNATSIESIEFCSGGARETLVREEP